jgi:hypothetical protein
MKHCLIPTDFSVDSLKAVNAAISIYKTENLKITMFHLLYMANDIGDLLFRTRREGYNELQNEEFIEVCEILKNMHQSKLESIQVQFGHGSTKAYVRNLMEGLGVDRIIICPDIQLQLSSPKSVQSMVPLLEATGIPVDKIPLSAIRNSSTDISVMNMLKGNRIKTLKNITNHAIEK